MEKAYEFDRQNPLAGAMPEPPPPGQPGIDTDVAAKSLPHLPPSVRAHLEGRVSESTARMAEYSDDETRDDHGRWSGGGGGGGSSEGKISAAMGHITDVLSTISGDHPAASDLNSAHAAAAQAMAKLHAMAPFS